jgi:hypothetical protein
VLLGHVIAIPQWQERNLALALSLPLAQIMPFMSATRTDVGATCDPPYLELAFSRSKSFSPLGVLLI